MTAERPRIVFALDFATLGQATEAAHEVAVSVGMLKVGLELFMREGASAVELGASVGLPVFLDLKLHDIPETVERAVRQAARLGARWLTVHACGGREMLRRAVACARDSGSLDVCAVTVLTSLDDADVADIGFREGSEAMAVRLARLAWEEGVTHFVCSPHEASALRLALGAGAVLITPGVRPDASAKGDQKRAATPAQALKNGADWIVVGRPIRDAENRLAAAQSIARSMTTGCA